MNRPVTYRENTADGPIIHLDGAEQDYTLCGYAFEGACDGSEHDKELTLIHRGKVTCRTCVTIWKYCRTIAPRYIAQ